MNRSSGAYVRLNWVDYAIVIKLPEGGYQETVKTATSRREALGMAFRGLPEGSKVAFCKTAQEMTRDERGRYGMDDLPEDRIADARERHQRSAAFHHYADLY